MKLAELLDDEDLVSFEEMLIDGWIKVDALAQLLIEEALFTGNNFYTGKR